MFVAPLYGSGPFEALAFIMLLAFAFDVALGDPQWLYRVLPHPVALLGRLIDWLETRLNRTERGARARFVRGAIVTAACILLAGALGLGIAFLCRGVTGGWLIEAAVASSLIAFRGLHDHVLAVIKGLGQSLSAARDAVGHIVGRNPDVLDAPGIARAAAESLAENFSDGVVAPLFWYLLFGLPGLFVYKALNTLDSMVGYRNPRFEQFGKTAAKLDDWANWLPARLAGLIFCAAAIVLPKGDAAAAWRTMRRDAAKHRSPNAGWQEAALAGALGFALAGPRRYGSETVQDHWMGDGRRNLETADIRAALRLYLAAGALLGTGVLALWVMI